jgi:lantibiotic modifying enzyme
VQRRPWNWSCSASCLELLKTPLYLAEGGTAIETTLDSVERDVCAPDANLSLCHGLAGNAEILAQASLLLGPTWAEAGRARSAVQAAGRCICAHYIRMMPQSFEAQGPGLMIGLAGIGYFCLRLAEPFLPSVLLL